MWEFLKSKRVLGGIAIALGQILPLLQSGFFGPKAVAIATAVGAILVAVGMKDATDKTNATVQDAAGASGGHAAAVEQLQGGLVAAQASAARAEAVASLAAQATGVQIQRHDIR
jgi:hypothetical protein